MSSAFRPTHPWKPGNCPCSHLHDIAHNLGVSVKKIRHNAGRTGVWRFDIDFDGNAKAHPWSHDPADAVRNAEQAIIEYGRMVADGEK